MRAKEAIEVECRTAQRSVEKQTKLLERAQEVERGLTAQVVGAYTYYWCGAEDKQVAHESGLTALRNAALDLQNQLAAVTSERTQFELRLQQSQASLADVSSHPCI
jgi:E3 ubiquitin-protein ligase BRE1